MLTKPVYEPSELDAIPHDVVESGLTNKSTIKEWVNEVADSVRLRRKRKQVKQAWRREREEAEDAARLDQVLQRVGKHGTEGLSPEDAALLKRVSENLRRQRESESEQP